MAGMDTDADLLSGALSDDGGDTGGHIEQQTPAPVTAPEPAGDRQRDEAGRFAPKAAEAAPAQAQTAPNADADPTEKDGHVPSWRYREIAQQRREAESRARQIEEQYQALLQRQMQAPQVQPQTPPQPAELPDPVTDPQGYHRHVQQVVEQNARNLRVEMSMENAHDTHGEKFEAAYNALLQAGQSGDRMTVQRIYNAPNPGKALMQWHSQQSVYRETGGDLDKYRQKILDEALANPDFQAKAIAAFQQRGQGAPNGQPRNVVQLSPSLGRATAAASATDGNDDSSDRGLLASALHGKTR